MAILARRMVLGGLLACALAGPAVASETPPQPKPAPKMLDVREDASEFRILTFNVQFLNRSYGAFDDYLETVKPDVVVLQEARKAWLRETRLREYPFQRAEPGLVLASRFPIDAADVAGSDGHRIRDVRAYQRVTLLLPAGGVEQAVTLYNFHPVSPRMENGEARRKADYAALAEALAQESAERPLIVAGDFNAVPTEALMASLNAEAGLSVFDGGTIATPTRFARELGMPPWVGVPIDHVAARGPFELVSRKVGPDIGSDHLPVVVDVRFGKAN